MKVDAIPQRESWASVKTRLEKTPAKETEEVKKTVTAEQKKAAMSSPAAEELKARKKYMAATHESPVPKKSTAKTESLVDILA